MEEITTVYSLFLFSYSAVADVATAVETMVSLVEMTAVQQLSGYLSYLAAVETEADSSVETVVVAAAS